MATATEDRSMNSYPRTRLGEDFGPRCVWVTVSRTCDFGPMKLCSILFVAVMTVAAAPTAAVAQWLGRDPVFAPLVVGVPSCDCLVLPHAYALTYYWYAPRLSQRRSAPHDVTHSKSKLHPTKQRTVDVTANAATPRDQIQLKRQSTMELDEREALYQQFLEWSKNQSPQGRR
jgi:hypothetical protein